MNESELRQYLGTLIWEAGISFGKDIDITFDGTRHSYRKGEIVDVALFLSIIFPADRNL